jgi:hypothetical protein
MARDLLFVLRVWKRWLWMFGDMDLYVWDGVGFGVYVFLAVCRDKEMLMARCM